MKIANNTLPAVFDYVQKQLSGMYPEREVRNFVKLALEHFFDYDSKYLSLHPNLRFTESELLKFVFMTKELRTGRPIQYVLGETVFYQCRIKVSPSVLIPRPETEELVEWILKEHRGKNPLHILDIGTGSGCIPIALKKNLTSSAVFAMDLSTEALNTAKENALLNNVDIAWIKKDVFDHAGTSFDETFDVIVSNPPYVLESEKKQMHSNVFEHEPHLALFVHDDDPLVFYKAIAEVSLKNLKRGGFLYLEINEKYGDETQALLKEKGFREIELRKDLSGKDRMIRARLV